MKKPAQEAITELTAGLNDPATTKQEYIRIQAVLLRKERYSRVQISRIVKKSISVIENWITAYNADGISGLKNHYSKESNFSKITTKQREHIHKILREKTPVEMGFVEEYWNISLVRKLVKKLYQVEYTGTESYRKLLGGAGLSSQRVQFVDKRKKENTKEEMRKRYEGKIKGGRISMWW